MRRLRIPAVVSMALVCAWAGAEMLLRWRPAAPTPDLPRVVAPPEPPRPAVVAMPAPTPRATPPPALPMPRVVTPDGREIAARAPLRGVSRVGDGDSLEVGGMRIRLVGIDAPELHQVCRDRSGQPVACGQLAKAALEALGHAGPVTCTPLDTDRFDRILAVCSNGREEINRAMVRAGWAFAYEGDPTYVAEEQAAARAGRGIHALQYDRPAAWRRAHPR